MLLFPENRLVIASHNEGKVTEIKEYLKAFNLSISTAKDFNINEPEETEDTFEGNALLKARAVSNNTQLAALADDSGLVVPSLNGAPGIYSARWAGLQKDFTLAMARVEQELKGKSDYSAYFVCVLALVLPNGQEFTFRGEAHGYLTFPPRGNMGFGYDPIFIPNGYSKTVGEMTSEEKRNISHRTEAFKELLNSDLFKIKKAF